MVFVGEIANEREQPAGNAFAGMVGVRVHDTQRDVRFALTIKARARNASGCLIYREQATPGIEILVNLAEQ